MYLQIRPWSQHGASIASWALEWCWNRLDFYSSVVSPALANVQTNQNSIKLLSNNFDIKNRIWLMKKITFFLVTFMTLVAPASYYGTKFSMHAVAQCIAPTLVCRLGSSRSRQPTSTLQVLMIPVDTKLSGLGSTFSKEKTCSQATVSWREQEERWREYEKWVHV